MKIVVATFDAGGNTPPLLAIARELARRGHAVTVAVEPHQADDIHDLPVHAYATPLRARRPRTQLGAAVGLARVFADRRLGQEIVRLARDADVVVVDCLLVGTVHELAAAGIRTITVVHLMLSFLRSAASGPFGLIIRLLGGGSAARSLQLPEKLIVTTIADWERTPLDDPRVHHVGPVDALPSPGRPDAGDPLVVVSLSTTPNPGQERTLQSIADALGWLPVRGLLSGAGLVDPASLRLPPNVEAVSWIDHAAVLPRAALLVGHGGHGTTVRALAAGIPVLALPVNPLGDQPWVGRALERAGAGRMLSPRSSPAHIREAIVELLADPSARDAARALGELLRDSPGIAGAADLVGR